MAVIAASELRIVAAIATPCSVKAYGRFRVPPRPAFDIAICDIKATSSDSVSWNAYPSNRDRLRRSRSFSRRVYPEQARQVPVEDDAGAPDFQGRDPPVSGAP